MIWELGTFSLFPRFDVSKLTMASPHIVSPAPTLLNLSRHPGHVHLR